MRDSLRPRLRGAAHLAALLLLGLALAACGRGEEAEVVPTATLIPTLAPLEMATATPVPTEAPTAVPEPTAEPTVAAGEAITATEATTATEAVTTTEAATATEEVTAGAELTATEAVTATEGVTAGAEITPTEELTGTEAVTATEAVTTTEAITGTEAVTAGEEVTATEPVTATEEVTAGEAITAGAALTGTETITTTEGVTATEAMTTDMTTAAAPLRVFFLQPTDNAIVPLTATVVVSYTGVVLGQQDGTEEAGSLHLSVDAPFVPAGEEIPDDELHARLTDATAPVGVALSPGSAMWSASPSCSRSTWLPGDESRAEIVVNAVDGAPEQAVRIVSPTDGATVPPTFTVVMAATGLNVEPSGAVNENAGHLHLLVDTGFVRPVEVIPADDTHLHFGKGQLTGTVTLEPGEHVLRLQFANGLHAALPGDQYRDEITVNVVEDAPAEQVMFVTPEDGATVQSPVTVKWAAAGLIVETAGQAIRRNGGHLHLLVDEEFTRPGNAIAADDTHLHFGPAQTETELELAPGEHTLRLQMADGVHRAKGGEQYQDEITITVE